MQDIAESKKELRQQFRADRRSLTQAEWQEKSISICENIAHSIQFQQASVVLAFRSANQEPDLSFLWQQFSQKTTQDNVKKTSEKNFEKSHKTWGFPKTGENYSLNWHKIEIEHIESSCAPGKYGIYEPLDNQPLIDLAQVDLILVPAVACDRLGIRLGNGGGYYDRFLAHMSDREQGCYKLGITFDLALVDSLPRDRWDVVLDGVCTEFGIFTN
jgi:5-formyltetrahydrofolate cyclo-ligase